MGEGDDERRARLARALRANLRRRKAVEPGEGPAPVEDPGLAPPPPPDHD